MGYLDSSSSVITAILTRKGRESLAKNDGSFRISKFAFGDDEINYQLYTAATESDTDILNLPVLEPSSNELTALRYRLITAPRGTIQAAYIQANPISLSLVTAFTAAKYGGQSTGIVKVTTVGGDDTEYLVTSQDQSIAYPLGGPWIATFDQLTGEEMALITIQGSDAGATKIDIVGKDTGALLSIPVTVTEQTVQNPA